MVELRHPAASHELPSFITAPGETDVLMVVMSLFLARLRLRPTRCIRIRIPTAVDSRSM